MQASPGTGMIRDLVLWRYPPIALMAYSPFIPGTLADEVSPSAEFVAKYTGIENVTIFAAYFHTDHNGQGVYKGYRVHEGLDTVRLWASMPFR